MAEACSTTSATTFTELVDQPRLHASWPTPTAGKSRRVHRSPRTSTPRSTRCWHARAPYLLDVAIPRRPERVTRWWPPARRCPTCLAPSTWLSARCAPSRPASRRPRPSRRRAPALRPMRSSASAGKRSRRQRTARGRAARGRGRGRGVPMKPHPVRPGGEQARRALARDGHDLPPRLQHRVAVGRSPPKIATMSRITIIVKADELGVRAAHQAAQQAGQRATRSPTSPTTDAIERELVLFKVQRRPRPPQRDHRDRQRLPRQDRRRGHATALTIEATGDASRSSRPWRTCSAPTASARSRAPAWSPWAAATTRRRFSPHGAPGAQAQPHSATPAVSAAACSTAMNGNTAKDARRMAVTIYYENDVRARGSSRARRSPSSATALRATPTR